MFLLYSGVDWNIYNKVNIYSQYTTGWLRSNCEPTLHLSSPDLPLYRILTDPFEVWLGSFSNEVCSPTKVHKLSGLRKNMNHILVYGEIWTTKAKHMWYTPTRLFICVHLAEPTDVTDWRHRVVGLNEGCAYTVQSQWEDNSSTTINLAHKENRNAFRSIV